MIRKRKRVGGKDTMSMLSYSGVETLWYKVHARHRYSTNGGNLSQATERWIGFYAPA